MAEAGEMQVLQYLHTRQPLSLSSDAIDKAACNSHVDLAQWIHDICGERCSRRAIDYAAEGGHLDAVR